MISLLLINQLQVSGQNNTEKKYPSLLWEITGNGLKKPSYLFGTMHVSNKMVFHLSDSFFIAIRNSDCVGLELNSDTWQAEMIAMDKQKENFYKFYGNSNNDYSTAFNRYRNNYGIGIKDFTFRQENFYIYQIQNALQETPFIINSLLYRTRDYKQDFEENTFLDMYIYQTGKKLGKKSVGMETIFTMEKYTTEAEIDRVNEKNKKKKKYNYDEVPEMSSDDAYRKGDLDMLDSLDRFNVESEAYIEKFLYQRNNVQANSMDTIMKKGKSLFVGVGASHLPGKRGVIEILRKMGYRLRPIKMLDRDATQREKIDKIRVPVQFVQNVSADQFYTVNVPGKLYTRTDNYNSMSVQYADMSNGTYYMITRVPTNASYYGIEASTILNKIDSLLYENVPGKILTKKPISKNGYPGLDITNKTRRGDVQRYQLLITPFEVLIFKMSGNDDYVLLGKEAELFFGSIRFKEYKINWANYTYRPGNYSAFLPHEPVGTVTEGSDQTSVAVDSAAKISYLIQKKKIPGTGIYVEDSINLQLMEESFIGNEKKLVPVNKTYSLEDGANCMLVNYALADSFLQVKYIIKGELFYCVAVKGKNKIPVFENKMIPSFRILPFPDYKTELYIDTFLKFSVKTPFKPVVVDSIKALLYKFNNLDRGYSGAHDKEYQSWGTDESMYFTNDTTGESVMVSFSKDAKYSFLPDSVKMEEKLLDSMAVVLKNPTALAKFADSLNKAKYPVWYANSEIAKNPYRYLQRELIRKDGYNIRNYLYTDTGFSKLVREMYIRKDNYGFHLAANTDISNSSSFINGFFESFKPAADIKGESLYVNKMDTFFRDIYSTDTVTRKLARSAIRSMNFTKNELPRMLDAFRQLSLKEKDYYDTKNKWIYAIANIPDSTIVSEKLSFLNSVYENTTDTSIFQNNVLNQLVGLKTTASYKLLKKFLLLDPPISDNNYDYGYNYDYDTKFNFFKDDSLELNSTLFPEILDLADIDDYKNVITNTLIKLVDSNKIETKNYDRYASKILFDAKIALKKKLLSDEKKVKKDFETENPDDIDEDQPAYQYSNSNIEMMDYVSLLLPFYQKNPAIPVFIGKLWKLKDDMLKFRLLLKAIDKKIAYPDSLLAYFAGKEPVRGLLYYRLSKLKKADLFPTALLNPDDMAKAFLYTSIDDADQLDSADQSVDSSPLFLNDSYSFPTGLQFPKAYGYHNNDISFGKKMDSIKLIRKEIMEINKMKGWIFIYQYRKNKEDKWRLAFSGLQPLDGKTVSYKNYITTLIDDRKINEENPIEEQIQKELKRIRFSKNSKTAGFFTSENNRYNRGDY